MINIISSINDLVDYFFLTRPNHHVKIQIDAKDDYLNISAVYGFLKITKPWYGTDHKEFVDSLFIELDLSKDNKEYKPWYE
jgi:hypothetical protein